MISRGRNSQLASERHRVEAVVDQVYENLLQLIGVRENGGKTLGHISLEFDISGHQCGLRCIQYLQEQRVDVDRLESQYGSSSRIEHRSNYIGDPVYLSGDDVEPLNHPLILCASAE